jgi:hypothetical protein
MLVVVNSLFYWWRKPVVSSDPIDKLNSQYTHYCSVDVVFIQNVILVPMVIIVDHDVIHVSTGYNPTTCLIIQTVKHNESVHRRFSSGNNHFEL